eukprot:Blabericola_migrator_1__8862@NODE_468_length_8228_cov_102_004044_g365_i0_p2_GENE_NODE_468_length_8228_cov_102_004044_g365_i0NODE_468_length_8228_cov_102_004044_g365_i0_p2_ORF_typecomplete_len513_score14_77zfRING_2/PF13639_6/5_5e16zfRING_11/PF17123_5/4e10zfRING_11/PF17123_5/3e02zfrbx1/PF12678_7/2_1e09zfC3HC4_2/PF13923_6/1_8e07zfC3HC4/PF00097_25/8_6e07zfC3HC4_3/PF13920_6/8_3e06zfRING_5/PF14634_6/1_1e05zfRING_UBOX/PF13445_6/8_7e06zfRING_UBOX/PF13445_6/6_7e02ProkRING_4/PF14447_6/4e05zfANAPC11/PF1286
MTTITQFAPKESASLRKLHEVLATRRVPPPGRNTTSAFDGVRRPQEEVGPVRKPVQRAKTRITPIDYTRMWTPLVASPSSASTNSSSTVANSHRHRTTSGNTTSSGTDRSIEAGAPPSNNVAAEPHSSRRRSTSIRRTVAPLANPNITSQPISTTCPNNTIPPPLHSPLHLQMAQPPITAAPAFGGRRQPLTSLNMSGSAPLSTTSGHFGGSSRRVQSVGNRQHRSSRPVPQNTPPSRSFPTFPDPIEASLLLGTRVRYSYYANSANRAAGPPTSLRHPPSWAPLQSLETSDARGGGGRPHGLPPDVEGRTHHPRSSRAFRGLRSSAPAEHVVNSPGFVTGQIMSITSLLGNMHSTPGNETSPPKKGVDSHVLKILPVSVFAGARVAGMADELRQCMVCLEEFTEGEKLRWLPCLHAFHCDCIDTWLKSATSCPICKCDVEKTQPRRDGGSNCHDQLTPRTPTTTTNTTTTTTTTPSNTSSPRCNLPLSLFPPTILGPPRVPPLVSATTPPK